MTALRKEDVDTKEGYTVKDIYALPEGERAELINGQIYYMAPPSRSHQRVCGKLYQTIVNYIEANKGNCEVYVAPFAVFLNNDDSNYVEPDISVICDTSKLDEKGCHGAPDWIIEVVSPGNKQMDYLIKLLRYQTAGVREYWIAASPPYKTFTFLLSFIFSCSFIVVFLLIACLVASLVA